MSKHFFSILAIILLLAMLPVPGSADIAAKSGNLALFLKPTWSTGNATQGHWEWDNTHEWYVEGTSPEGHGGRKFYQYGLSQAGWNKYSRISVEFDNQIICKRR